MDESKLLWKPSLEQISSSHLKKYVDWLMEESIVDVKADTWSETYENLWSWSTTYYKHFWTSLFTFFDVIYDGELEPVISQKEMPGIQWFENCRLNYAEQIFKNANSSEPAVIFADEKGAYDEISWDKLEMKVAAFAQHLRFRGVKKGDRVVAFLPNIPEATIAFLAVNSLGAIWSSCSPDFGADSVVDRFQQVEAKIFITVASYSYSNKTYDKRAVVSEIIDSLDTLEEIVFVDPNCESNFPETSVRVSDWEECLKSAVPQKLTFTRVPFNHPIWVLYSSGTTGLPKAITHSHGGVLLEHLKYLAFHNDVHAGERFFWFSTTGWMMWNFIHASMLVGATIVLYDGNPGYPGIETLWRLAEKAKISHFGTSAPFLIACMKKEICPKNDFDLSHLRSIGSTGSPLPPEAFTWTYENISKDVWLCSMAGGTDVCTAFVGGNPVLPLYLGEIQSRALGCSLYSYNEQGKEILGQVGEMVITKPMPSMPIYFWNDQEYDRYKSSYFDMYEGIWRHGDWISIDSQRKSLVIYGRSDATLNRQGIRIGTAEIYRAIDKISDVNDSLIVNIELSKGRHYMPLFVQLKEGKNLGDDLKTSIKTILKEEYTPRHVPDEIIEVKEIPYTISGKKMESPIKKILMKLPLEKSVNADSMKNPDSLDFFIDFAKNID